MNRREELVEKFEKERVCELKDVTDAMVRDSEDREKERARKGKARMRKSERKEEKKQRRTSHTIGEGSSRLIQTGSECRNSLQARAMISKGERGSKTHTEKDRDAATE